MATKSGKGTAPEAPASPVRQQGMGPIQVIPPGLMGLLQLKQTGRLPSTLSETVVPVLELREWYMTGRRLTEAALFPGAQPNTGLLTAHAFYPFNAAGGGTCLVPENEIWWVEQMSANAVATAAADVCNIGLGLNAPSGFVQWVSATQADYTGTRVRRFMVHADRAFWAFPGDQFILGLFDVASVGGINFALSIRATRCPI